MNGTEGLAPNVSWQLDQHLNGLIEAKTPLLTSFMQACPIWSVFIRLQIELFVCIWGIVSQLQSSTHLGLAFITFPWQPIEKLPGKDPMQFIKLLVVWDKCHTYQADSPSPGLISHSNLANATASVSSLQSAPRKYRSGISVSNWYHRCM